MARCDFGGAAVTVKGLDLDQLGQGVELQDAALDVAVQQQGQDFACRVAVLGEEVCCLSPCLFGTLAATTLLMALHWALSRASARWPILSLWVEGPAVRLGEHGKVDEGLLQRHAVTRPALEESLRRANIESTDEARLIVLESSGKISVLRE